MPVIAANSNLYASLYKARSASNIGGRVAPWAGQLPPLIHSLKNGIKAATGMSELTHVFERAVKSRELQRLHPVSYALGEYKLLIACAELSDRLADNLEQANLLALQSAPILVENVGSKDPDLKVLITHEPGLEGDTERFDTYATALLAGSIDPESQWFFMKEIEALFDAGYINFSILEDGISLKMNPKSGLVFASNWEMLESTAGFERGDYLRAVRASLRIG